MENRWTAKSFTWATISHCLHADKNLWAIGATTLSQTKWMQPAPMCWQPSPCRLEVSLSLIFLTLNCTWSSSCWPSLDSSGSGQHHGINFCIFWWSTGRICTCLGWACGRIRVSVGLVFSLCQLYSQRSTHTCQHGRQCTRVHTHPTSTVVPDWPAAQCSWFLRRVAGVG